MLKAKLHMAEVNPHLKKNTCKCGVRFNKHGHNLQNIASKTNQHWLITYEKPLIHFGTDIFKIVAVLVKSDTS